MSTLSGWGQQSKNWIVQKLNNDTIITYNFTKNDLRNLHVYVLSLEKVYELYNVDKKILSTKDSIILNYKKQIENRESVILTRDSLISYQSDKIVKLDKWGKEQENLKIKYKSQSKYFFGCGSIIGFVLCLILIK